MSSTNNNNQQNSQQFQNPNQNHQDTPFRPFTFIINTSPQNNNNNQSDNANNTLPSISIPIHIQVPISAQSPQPEPSQNTNTTPTMNLNNNGQTPDTTANPSNNDQASTTPPPQNGTSPFIHFFFYPIGEGATPAGMMFFTPFFMTPEVQKPRASEQAMKELPIVEITKEHITEQASCPICLDQFQMPSDKENPDSKCRLVREMPCRHRFCETCLFEWLRQSNTCPLCRKEIESEVEQAQEQPSNQQTASSSGEANSARPTQEQNNTAPVRQQQSRGVRHSPYTYRNTNGRHQTTCALDRVGCCGESNTNESPSPILTLPQCHHRFHSSCLRTSLLVEGYSLDTPNLTFRCPTCRAPAQLQNEELKMVGWINNLKNEQEESQRSTGIPSLPITIRLPNDAQQDCPEMDLD